jgi:hypothetical protein
MTNAIAARLRGRDHKDCPCYCCDGAREIERLEHELKEAQADAAQSRGWGEAAIARMAESTQETEPAPLCGNCGRDGCDYCDPR